MEFDFDDFLIEQGMRKGTSKGCYCSGAVLKALYRVTDPDIQDRTWYRVDVDKMGIRWKKADDL